MLAVPHSRQWAWGRVRPGGVGVPESRSSTEHGKLMLAGILLAAAVLRFSTLSLQSFWSDEAATVGLVRRSYGSMLAAIPGKERTPFAYYVVAWIWSRVFGHGEFGLRSLSAVFGTVTVLLAFLVARRLEGERAGFLAAAFVAVSPILVWYSQEARSYAMLACCCVASVWTWQHVRDSRSTGWLLAWGAVSTVAITTHYFASFVVALEAVALLRLPVQRRALGATLGVLAAVQIALLPLAIHQAHAQAAGDYITATSLPGRIIATPERFLLGEHGAPTLFTRDVCALGLLLSVGIVGWLFLFRTSSQTRRAALPILCLAIASAGLPLLLSVAGLDFFAYRNLLVVWVLFLIAGAIVLGASDSGLASGATAGLILAFSFLTVAVNLTPELQRGDWRYAATALAHPEWRRLIVVSPFYDEGVFRIYVPEVGFARRSHVRVREIDLIGYQLPPGRQPPRVAPGFTVATVIDHQKLSFVRYLATRPRTVTVRRVPPLLAGTRAFLIEAATP
jgi:mannosyltransferase